MKSVSPGRSILWPFTILLCVLATLVAGCVKDSTETTEPESAGEALVTGEAMDLDVLVYNVEYGGDASTDAVITDLDADVVGVLESYNRLPEIAENTGYPYYDVGLQILSKYPILEPSGADGLYALIEVQPGYVIAFFNTHLDYVAFGPKLLAEGKTVRRGAGVRGRGAYVVHGDPPAGTGAALVRRLPDVPHRGLQRTLQPRLHRRDRRDARGCRRSGAVAGQREPLRHRLQRLLPRDQP